MPESIFDTHRRFNFFDADCASGQDRRVSLWQEAGI